MVSKFIPEPAWTVTRAEPHLRRHGKIGRAKQSIGCYVHWPIGSGHSTLPDRLLVKRSVSHADLK
eukprot:2733493-Amphidinium_carterae.1